MRTIVTGGRGFLGAALVDRLRARDTDGEVLSADVVDDADVVVRLPDVWPLVPLLAAGPCTVVHLASVVSAAAELDWRTAVEVNVDGVVALLRACEASGHRHRVVFASSVAVFGRLDSLAPPGPRTRQTPTSSYGATKAIGELLIADRHRRGAIDGRVARLPTVVVRPGRPNAAASSFASSMFREPLAGLPADVPVPDDVGMVVIGAATAVGGLLALTLLPDGRLGDEPDLNLPGLTVTVGGMRATLERVGGPDAVALLRDRPDPSIEQIVRGWPSTWDDERARSLGLPADDDLDAVVRAHLT